MTWWHTQARWLLLPALLAGGIGSTFAFRLAVSHWDNARTTVFSGIPGVSPSGQSWADALRSDMERWNDATPFQFQIDPGYRNPCAGYDGFDGNGDLQNGADFRSDICGIPFDSGALAITLTRWINTQVPESLTVEADMVFNTRYSWDIYDGPLRATTDFRRVALHELGHVLGLQHELTNPSIMSPQVTVLSQPTADDVAGVNALYPYAGGESPCPIRQVASTIRLGGALSTPDCQMRQVFGGSDPSLVDRYQMDLPTEGSLSVQTQAIGFDPVLIITRLDREVVDVFESAGNCTASGTTAPLPPGAYFVMVNTYDQPRDCGAGQGQYELSIADSPMPLLGAARSFAQSGGPVGILFQAGARRSGGQGYGSLFAPTDDIDVDGRILVAPEHAGQQGSIYVVAVLDDGRSYMKDATGAFIPFSGGPQDLRPTRQQTLGSAPMAFEVARGLRGDLTGLSGHVFYVFIGYSVASTPDTIYYPNAPLSFRIAPQ